MSLRRKVLSSLFWAGGTRLLGQVLTWAITIVVIRLLSPHDYGLLAMATVFVGFLILMAEAGLGAALVQAPAVNDFMLRGMFGAVILVDAALFLLLVAAAPVIAQFFEEDRLVWIIRVLALQFLLGIFAVIPGALLTRTLDFKRPSMIGLAGVMCGSLSSLGLALFGYGVWALVVGNLVTQLFNTVAINVLSPFLKWPDFSLKGARGLITFGGQVTAARILWFLYSQADILIAGKLLGKELLGFYSVSMHLASLPVQRVSAVLNQVAFPAFALIQGERGLVASNVLKAFRLLGFVAFPVCFGISSIAPELIAVLLGPKWNLAILPLQLLALIMPLRMIGNFLPSAVDGIGRADVGLKNLAYAVVIMPLAFLLGSQWGLLGLSLAWVTAFPIVFFFNLSRSLEVLDLHVFSFLSAVARPALSSAVMYGAVVAAKWILGAQTEGITGLLTLIAVGAAIYGILVAGFNRSGASEIKAVFGS